MPSVVIKIKNLDEIIAKLGELATLKWVRGILAAAAQDVKGGVGVYPPSSEANKPRQWQPGGDNTWYERGFGTKRVRKDGSVAMRQTSETLGRRWTTQVGDTWAKVGNSASYARYVQDKKDQARIHAQRGWSTVQDEGEKAMEGALRKVEAEVDRIWRG